MVNGGSLAEDELRPGTRRNRCPQAAARQGHLSRWGARTTASLIDAGLVDDPGLLFMSQDMPCSRGIGDIGPLGIARSCCSGTPLRYCVSKLSGSISTPAGFAAKASVCM